MSASDKNSFTLPLEAELGLHRLTNAAGVEIGVLPNGSVFAIEYAGPSGRVLVNQVFGSPLGGGIGRILARVGPERKPVAIAGAGSGLAVGAAGDRFVWEGETDALRHRVTLWLHPERAVWLWRVELENTGPVPLESDAVLIQDLGLGGRGLVLSNEAYASQYIDHFIGRHPRLGPVIMSRQNMAQADRNPWVAHGCLDGAAAFATDAIQIFGPGFRANGETAPAYGANLPSVKLQGEAACPALQSAPLTLKAGETASRTFFAAYEPHHPAATSDTDLTCVEAAEKAAHDFTAIAVPLARPARSILEDAPPLSGLPLTTEAIAERYPERAHDEWQDGVLLSSFAPDGPHNRHVVLPAKDRLMKRPHGVILRSGTAILPDDGVLSATCWMHGVFGAQLTVGNTALQKLTSVARDPYNITRTSGLRMLVDRGDGWRLLAVPSLFEMGLSDCRWLYRFDDGEIGVHALMSTEDGAAEWHVTASGKPCRFIVVAHLIMGEHEYRHPGSIEIDNGAHRITLRPDTDGLWGHAFPGAVHHLVTSTPGAVEAMGSGALLFEGDAPRAADAYAVIRSGPTDRLSFALVAASADTQHAERACRKI